MLTRGEHAIATARALAIGTTSSAGFITIGLAVVAFFKTAVQQAIATASQLTIVQTSVAFLSIRVVTGLALIDDSVAAARQLTALGTPVARV